MILYDNKCNLLGVSRNVLSFLGYEDVEEFKTYTNDIADLFVNKSGYIYKFQNFSWIDYVLHSGAPNKNAIIKLKNGKEVETRINIEEIVLLNPIGENQTLYKVDLFNNYFGENQNAINTPPPIFDTPTMQPIETMEESTPINIEEEKNFTPSIEEESTPALAEDYDFSNSLTEETSPTPKLKLDENIFEEESKEERNESFEIKNDVESIEEIKINFDEKEEEKEPIAEDYDFSIKSDISEEYDSKPKLQINDDSFEITEEPKEEDEVKLNFDYNEEETTTSFEDEYKLSKVEEDIEADTTYDFDDEKTEDIDSNIVVKNDQVQNLMEEDSFSNGLSVTDVENTSDSIDDLQIDPPKERTFFEKEEEINPSNNDLKTLSQERSYLHEATLALGVDEELLKPILKEYVDQLEMSLHAIEESFMQHDTQTLIEVVEQLKGISENLRLTELTEVLVAFLRPWDEIPANNIERYTSIVDSLKNETL